MIGADVGGSHGRPEYVIPTLDLEGYFQRFFAERDAIRAVLPKSAGTPSGDVPVPSDPSTGIDDVDAWAESLLLHREHLERKAWRGGLDMLQKKFAVFGRVQRSYGPSMRKTTEEEVSGSTLCRLAILLLGRYGSSSDLNSLNSAIKLLDAAVKRYSVGDADPSFAALLSHALTLEDSFLRKLHHG